MGEHMLLKVPLVVILQFGMYLEMPGSVDLDS